jgi:hypothetical protein
MYFLVKFYAFLVQPAGGCSLPACRADPTAFPISRNARFPRGSSIDKEGWLNLCEEGSIISSMQDISSSLRSCMAAGCRILTAVLFVVHILVGCCAHHAHASDGRCHLPPVQETATPEGPRPDASGSPKNHCSHGPQDCQGVTCSFIPAADSPLIGRSSFRLGQTPTALLSNDDSSLLVSSFKRPFFSASASRLSPPVRLYLLHRVLLI